MVFEKICLCFFLYIGLYAVRGTTFTHDGYMEHGLKGGEKFPRAYVGNRQYVFPDWITDLIFTKKCLDGLGCFDTGPPFYHPLLRPISLTPFDLKNMKTKFYLYTSKHQRTILEPNDKSFSQAPYNKSLGLQIFIHGFQMQFTPDILAATEEVIGAIMNASGQNLILVDWSASNKDNYPQAVANGRVVGAQVAQLIKYLQKAAGLDPRKIHLIGHSLGSHVSGWAGERTKNLGRITGLDPAGPYFQFGPAKIRLDTTDAEFVDIIHTNAAEVAIEGLGIEQPIGHIDFYVNDGTLQPGCDGVLNTTIAGIKVDIMLPIKVPMITLLSIICSHIRAIDYFLESAANKKCKFIGTECPSYSKYKWGKCTMNRKAEMGLFAKKSSDIKIGSKFYLTTSEKQPFCIPNKAIQ